jgi:hypothetical protein
VDQCATILVTKKAEWLNAHDQSQLLNGNIPHPSANQSSPSQSTESACCAAALLDFLNAVQYKALGGGSQHSQQSAILVTLSPPEVTSLVEEMLTEQARRRPAHHIIYEPEQNRQTMTQHMSQYTSQHMSQQGQLASNEATLHPAAYRCNPQLQLALLTYYLLWLRSRRQTTAGSHPPNFHPTEGLQPQGARREETASANPVGPMWPNVVAEGVYLCNVKVNQLCSIAHQPHTPPSVRTMVRSFI